MTSLIERHQIFPLKLLLCVVLSCYLSPPISHSLHLLVLERRMTCSCAYDSGIVWGPPRDHLSLRFFLDGVRLAIREFPKIFRIFSFFKGRSFMHFFDRLGTVFICTIQNLGFLELCLEMSPVGSFLP